MASRFRCRNGHHWEDTFHDPTLVDGKVRCPLCGQESTPVVQDPDETLDEMAAAPFPPPSHGTVILGEGGVLLRDLGSGAGTKLNGERVTEKPVAHGDIIALGQTKLRFVEEAEQHRRLPQPVVTARPWATS